MNFRQIKHVDTFELVASLRDWMKQFDAVKLRQELQPQHHDTRTIYLRGPDPDACYVKTGKYMPSEAWFLDVPHTDTDVLKNWPEAGKALDAITEAMPRLFSLPLTQGYFRESMGKAMIVELAPAGVVYWHKDEGEYADKHDRYHLPLVTNPNCLMYSGPSVAHIPVGMLTYFNNHIPHSAVNFGDTPRYHLIVDFRKADAGNYSTS